MDTLQSGNMGRVQNGGEIRVIETVGDDGGKRERKIGHVTQRQTNETRGQQST